MTVELPFIPMLLQRASAPFADNRWIYQLKWDGVRNLTAICGGRVRHWSRRLRDRSASFPELDPLGKLFAGGDAVLDGEIVVMRGGRPSFAGILERDVAGRLNPQRLRQSPATLMIFDLLVYQGTDLTQRPLEERLEQLARVIEPTDTWQVVESFPGETGPALFTAVAEQGLEGVVAKRLGSLYLPGTRSRDWVKVKRRQRTTAVVCGYTSPTAGSGALLLGAYREEHLRYIGRAGSGLSGGDMQMIRAHLQPSPCPLERVPSLRDRFLGNPGPVTWTRPTLTVIVEFSEWTEDLKLRDPVIVGFASERPEGAVIT